MPTHYNDPNTTEKNRQRFTNSGMAKTNYEATSIFIRDIFNLSN